MLMTWKTTGSVITHFKGENKGNGFGRTGVVDQRIVLPVKERIAIDGQL